MKIFYTSKEYKENWESIFGKEEQSKEEQSKEEQSKEEQSKEEQSKEEQNDLDDYISQRFYKDSYGFDWRDIRFKPDSFDNFCLKYNLLDGYNNFFKEEEKEKEMDLQQMVLDVIVQFCDDMESFTSLDVSNEIKKSVSVRHREVAPLVRQAFMDGEMDFSGYIRTLIDVSLSNGQTSQAYLYHHSSDSPDSYNKRSQVALVPGTVDDATSDDDDDYSSTKYDPDPNDAQQAFDDALASKSDAQQAFDDALAASQKSTSSHVSVSTRIINTPTDDQVLEEDERETTCDGRVEVPVGWVSCMGWHPSDAIYAIHERNKVVLQKNVDQGDNVIATIYVSVDGRLRLTKMASYSIGWSVSVGQPRKIERFADRIEVSRVIVPQLPTATFTF